MCTHSLSGKEEQPKKQWAVFSREYLTQDHAEEEVLYKDQNGSHSSPQLILWKSE